MEHQISPSRFTPLSSLTWRLLKNPHVSIGNTSSFMVDCLIVMLVFGGDTCLFSESFWDVQKGQKTHPGLELTRQAPGCGFLVTTRMTTETSLGEDGILHLNICHNGILGWQMPKEKYLFSLESLNNHFLCQHLVHHPTETTIKKWMFG